MKLMFYFSYEVSISFSLSLSLHVVRDNSTGFVALIEKKKKKFLFFFTDQNSDGQHKYPIKLLSFVGLECTRI